MGTIDGVANKKALFVTLMNRVPRSEFGFGCGFGFGFGLGLTQNRNNEISSRSAGRL